MPQQEISLPIQRREATIIPASINVEARTVDVVWSTGAEVRRYDWERDAFFYEELEISEKAVRMERMNNGASVLNSHQSYDLNSVLGVVQRAWIEGKEGRATLLIDDSDPDSEKMWKRILKGIIRHISVGYAVYEFIEKRIGDKRILRAIDWEPFEVSFVPIGADAGAGVRSNPLTELPCKIVRNGDDMADQVEGSGPATPEAEAAKAEADAAAAEAQRAAASDQQQANQPADPAAGTAEQRGSEDTASEIFDMCELAGVDIRTARDFIKRAMSPDDVRAALIARKSNPDDTVSSHHQPGASEGRSAKIDFNGIYARYNGQEVKHG